MDLRLKHNSDAKEKRTPERTFGCPDGVESASRYLGRQSVAKKRCCSRPEEGTQKTQLVRRPVDHPAQVEWMTDREKSEGCDRFGGLLTISRKEPKVEATRQ